MVDRVNRINPVAKAMMQSRRRTQVVPNKKKYNRKRDKHASEDRHVPHQADKQTTDDLPATSTCVREAQEVCTA